MYERPNFIINDEEIVVILNNNGKQHLSVDEIIEKLSKCLSNTLSNHLDHQFFIEEFFPRLEQLLIKWINKSSKLDENESKIFRHITNLIFQMPNSIIDKHLNNEKYIHLIKQCLNNISSYGYYIFIPNQAEDLNLSSFDYLIQSYSKIKYVTK